MTRLACFLLLSGWAVAQPGTFRCLGAVRPGQTEKQPARASLGARLFGVKALAFVTDEGRVRVRVEIKNLTGSKAFFSVQAAIYDRRGGLLGAGGNNDVYHEKQRGQNYTEQFDFRVPAAELKRLDSFQVVFYEDSTFIGKR